MARKSKNKDDNYIFAYYQAIKDGSIVVGKWILLVYEYIVHGLESGAFYFDQKKANEAIDFIESHCFHTEGEKAPGPLKLELWQKAFYSAMYGLVDEEGYRQFREIVLIVARKNGKSLMAAASGKYTFMKDGGYGARVYTLAPKLDQADIIYNDIWAMIQLDPEWQERKKEIEEMRKDKKGPVDDSDLARHRMTDLMVPITNSTVKKIAFSAKKSDGFNPSLCICDEIASWPGENGLKQYEVMKSGQGARREGQLLSCSTSGYENEGIYDEILKRATRFLLGDSKEKRLLPFLYMIDDIEKWDDINELRKSNPNLGVSVTVDYLLDEVEIARASLSKKAEFITKYANLKQNSSMAFLAAHDIEKCCGAPLTLGDFAHSYAVCGIDLSQTTDLTAATMVIEKGGELYVFAKFWLPSEGIEDAIARDGLPYNAYITRGLLDPSGGHFIDYHDCFDWIRMLIEEYEILPLVIGYDRYSAQYLIQDLNAYGAQTDDVYQGDNLWPVIQEMEGLIKDGKVHIGDNDLLKIHLLNASVKMSIERGRGKLVKISANAHIDGVAALLDALTVRQKWYEQIGEQLRNE